MLAKVIGAEAAVVTLLGLPPIASATGVGWRFLAVILVAHIGAVVGVALLVRRWAHVPAVRAAHLPLVLTYNIGLTLTVVLHSGDPRTPWWYAYIMYAGISGAVQELQPARGLLVVFAGAPLLSLPGFVARGIPLHAAAASAVLAGGMGLLAYYLPAAASLRWRQLRAEQAEQLEAARQRAQELERQALARELHDAVGSHLAVVALYGDLLQQQRGDPAELAEISRQLREAAQSGLAELRTVLNALAPEVGTLDSVTSHARHLADRARAAGIATEVEVVGSPEALVPALPRLTAVRLVQEAVTNALRHSQTRRLRIRIELELAHLVIDVHDFGVGFCPAAAALGRGLPGMRKRVLAAGGRLELASEPGKGCQIRTWIPLQAGDAAT
ncbi:MAG: sensor histidine kinase [Deltaproteobacteria bacterium]|nr:sensor histidine kinase [Deltaproteobacteria bacterium]